MKSGLVRPSPAGSPGNAVLLKVWCSHKTGYFFYCFPVPSIYDHLFVAPFSELEDALFSVTCLSLSVSSMAENDADNELLDYEEDEEPQGAPESATPAGKKEVKGSYVSIHSSGFRDFLLKPELLRAIVDCGFEHPSEGRAQIIY